MRSLEAWHYEDVPRFGTVIVSPNAMASLERDSVSAAEVGATLALGLLKPDRREPGRGSCESAGIRLEIRTRRHLEGAAAVVVNGYRVTP